MAAARASFLLVFLWLCGSGTAWAGAQTVTNTTALTAYEGSAPTAYFGGTNPYVAEAPIGAEFQTLSLTVQQTAIQGGVLVDFLYLTRFDGSEVVGGQTVSNADMFLGTGGANSTKNFAYAIALGDQAGNGGVQAGFYSVTSVLTSQDIWTSRPGFVFGGAYGGSTAQVPGQPGYAASPAPTVLTAGRLLSGATVNEQSIGGGWYELNVDIIMTPAQAAYFAGGMDVFWGTGDCANGAFLADFLAVPEPACASVFGLGVALLAARGRRRVP